ncbi:hypothetical protein HYQ44_013393 [Verticillium longisporum]|nr:hypothetical protein HYQ44_013393 [Verticillium longisporum]
MARPRSFFPAEVIGTRLAGAEGAILDTVVFATCCFSNCESHIGRVSTHSLNYIVVSCLLAAQRSTPIVLN